MNTTQQLAKHCRDVHFGGNWTFVNLKDTLADITWQEATTQYQDSNTIATLLFHINYYINPVARVLQGEPLNASDKFSFDCPTITSQEEWEHLVQKALDEAEQFANEIEKLEESKLFEVFSDEKYGNYFRNLLGIIEHTHYHLGQIALIKKMIRHKD
ncbi:hypothetical protein GENT5_04910 [Flavobacterium ammoniigenes]|jgi:uncharacterized damage-inducible protein DinB|uniref:DinB superfamily protein n=1 Tax=Flavobacterium ammoniigenes TaxID=1751095 RepID=A0ABM7V3T8_9FLAO|nr:DinB family protein [Flavobacterium ammoniigenes]BDB54186.1 hypothetical protein GENT5_04910 [Flavobacterium ammoniigenes]